MVEREALAAFLQVLGFLIELLFGRISRVKFALARLVCDVLAIQLLHFYQDRLCHVLCYFGLGLAAIAFILTSY